MYGDVGIAEQQKIRRDDGIKQFSIQFSIQHPTYFSHYTCVEKICKMGLYTELFYLHTFLHLYSFNSLHINLNSTHTRSIVGA